MKVSRDLPIRRKLALVTLVASVITLALACGILFWFQSLTFRKGFLDGLSSIGSIIAQNSAPALAAGDAEGVNHVLSALKTKRGVSACILDSHNKPFAHFGRDNDWRSLAAISKEGVRFESEYAILRVPIDLDRKPLGTLCLRARFADQYRDLVSLYTGLFAAVIAGSLLVILLLSPVLQHIIATPILNLVDVARSIAEKQDYSVRAVESGNDEISLLTRTFNRMLDQIEGRDASLRELNASLEHEVFERKEVEAALRESRERYEAAVAGSNDGIWDWKLDVNTAYLSPRSKEILGFRDNEMRGDLEAWYSRLHPDDGERTLATLQEYLTGRSPTFEIEYRLQHKDGSYRWILSRGSALRDRAGKPVRMAGSHTDITVRKETDAEMEKLHQQLLLTSRQAGMAEVATGVLHNVGNALNSVNVSVNFLNQKVNQAHADNLLKVCSLLETHRTELGPFFNSNPKGQRLPLFLTQLARLESEQKVVLKREVETLGKNVEHIKQIIATQQSYARAGGFTEDLCVAELIDDALQMNAGAFLRHSITVKKQFQQVPPVRADRHKVLQILVNLLRNAQYALDEAEPLEKVLTLGVTLNGSGRVKVTVRDNGIGIPPENLTRIFGHGFTTKPDGHGFGLHSGALAAKEMGGSLHADSEGPGAGAIFTLELPLASEEDTLKRITEYHEQPA